MRPALAALAVLVALAPLATLACEPARTGVERIETDGGSDPVAQPCHSIEDLTGACGRDFSCLDTDLCSPTSSETCAIGAHGPGFCESGRCVYINDQISCRTAADCPCGRCHVPSARCVEDHFGACGSCVPTGNPGNGTGSPVCRACLASCFDNHTNITCCARRGCVCEGACLGYE